MPRRGHARDAGRAFLLSLTGKLPDAISCRMVDRSGTAARDAETKALHEAARLHEIEGNPLDAEDLAMFAMFEREGLTPEQRRAFIISQAGRSAAAAAE